MNKFYLVTEIDMGETLLGWFSFQWVDEHDINHKMLIEKRDDIEFFMKTFRNLEYKGLDGNGELR